MYKLIHGNIGLAVSCPPEPIDSDHFCEMTCVDDLASTESLLSRAACGAMVDSERLFAIVEAPDLVGNGSYRLLVIFHEREAGSKFLGKLRDRHGRRLVVRVAGRKGEIITLDSQNASVT
jgi:ribosomal protein L35AE/L33A